MLREFTVKSNMFYLNSDIDFTETEKRIFIPRGMYLRTSDFACWSWFAMKHSGHVKLHEMAQEKLEELYHERLNLPI